MAKLVIEKWQCDRCGKIEKQKPSIQALGEAFQVRVINEVEWAGGEVLKWSEMCRECNRAVEGEVATMRKSAQDARIAEASRHDD